MSARFAGSRRSAGVCILVWLAACLMLPQLCRAQERAPAVSNTVRVPQLAGYSLEEAVGILKGVGLRLGAVGSVVSRRKAGTVLRQNPPAGSTARLGSAVDVMLAKEELVSVPDVAGRTTDDARGILSQFHLQMRVDRERPSLGNPGSVLVQNPPAGAMVEPGSTVGVVVAVLVRVRVPNVVGQSVLNAEGILADPGLKLEIRGEQPSPQAPRTVLEQEPLPGTDVPVGSAVSVLVAAQERVRVPDLVGQNAQEAERMLAEPGLRLEVAGERPSPQAPRTVLEQKPTGGMVVAKGSTVSVIVAQGAVVQVPNLVGHGLVDARRLIQGTPGLELRVGRQRSSARAAGTVLAQTPAAGTMVPAGSTVRVVVAGGELAGPIILNADPVRSKTGRAVVFRAEIGPPASDVEYQYDFGDGSATQVSTEPVVRHAYADSGTYFAQVSVDSGSGRLLKSNLVTIQIEKGIDFSRLLAVLAGLLLLAGLAFFLVRYRPWDRLRLRSGTIRVTPVKDAGRQGVPGSAPVGFEVRFNAVRPEGEQAIQVKGPLVTGEEVSHE